jgi:ribosomal-protein-alanine N-acetyltransferase
MMIHNIKIKKSNILILPFLEENLYDYNYLNWLNDKEVIRYIGRTDYFIDVKIEDIEIYFNETLNNPHVLFFAIYYEEQFVGTCKLNFKNKENFNLKIVDIGIMIGNKNLWGKKISTKVINMLSEYAFNDMKIKKITAGANSNNIAMLKAFNNNGFKIEGVLRKVLDVDNELHNHVLFGCFKNELNLDI